MDNYFVWTNHGEIDGTDGVFHNVVVGESSRSVGNNVQHPRYHEMVADAFGMHFDYETHESVEQPPNEEAKYFYEPPAYVSLGMSVVSGFLGGAVMVAARGIWGPLFSHNKGIISGVKKMMLLMALLEVVNFPLAVCGGIVRGTARPWLGMYANISGFYLLALPLGVVLAFKIHLGLTGLLTGFVVGVAVCLVLLLVFIARIDWVQEAKKAQVFACNLEEIANV